MEMKTNETYKRLELERINTVMILQRLQKSTSDDPMKVQSYLQLTIKLQRIEAALARQKSQDYGICITCKNAIDPERLEALPYAEHCLSCQRQLEKKSAWTPSTILNQLPWLPLKHLKKENHNEHERSRFNRRSIQTA